MTVVRHTPLTPNDIAAIAKMRRAGVFWTKIAVLYERPSNTLRDAFLRATGIPAPKDSRSVAEPVAPTPTTYPAVTRYVRTAGLSDVRIPVSVAHVSLIDGPRS